jgi:hypothetical protein
MLRVKLLFGAVLISTFMQLPVWAQNEASPVASTKHEKFDLGKLRREARAKHEILVVTFFPDVDSVTNINKLYDVDELVQVQFIRVPKKAGRSE